MLNAQQVNVFNIPYALKSEETKLNGNIISKTGVKYSNYLENGINIPRVSEIYTESLKGTEKNITKIISYTNKGHIRETLTDGVSKTTIWGYNDSFPIAEIVGATYTQVENHISTIISKSNLDKDQTTENDLISALDTFRTKPELINFLITTYTYNPLIGVTSVTPPTGMREIYEYDLITNKLKQVKRLEKDPNGNDIYRTLKEYEYHYKP